MPRAFFVDVPTLNLPSGGPVDVSISREPGDPCRLVVVTADRRPRVILEIPWHDLQAIYGVAGRAIREEASQASAVSVPA